MKLSTIHEVEERCTEFAALFAAIDASGELRKLGRAPYTVAVVSAGANTHNGYDAVVIKDRSEYEIMFYLVDGALMLVFPCWECGAEVTASKVRNECEACAYQAAIGEEQAKQEAYEAWKRS